MVMILYFPNAFYIWNVKIASTLFLFAALIAMLYVNIGQVGGVYVGIDAAQIEASERLHIERLSTLTISSADLSSGRAVFNTQKEIMYNGNLYDIGSQTKQGDDIILKVLRDEKEENLLSDLKDMVDSWVNGLQKDSKQPSIKQIVLIKDYIPAHKFNFSFNSIMKELPSASPSDPSEAPLMAVLKSPPKFV